MKKLLVIAALAGAFGALAGCNTVDGIGQDISGGANTVSDWLG
jgi:predicted small secreted protein